MVTQPCKCGFHNDPTHDCGCSPAQIQQDISRISGPLVDRTDIYIDVPAVKYRELIANDPSKNSATIRERVAAARKVQQQRYASEKLFSNAQMGPRLIRKYCAIDDACQRLLEQAITKPGLSARAYNRILKVARTIADLEGREKIFSTNISEVIQYRSLDRNYWA
jgi:magnesium chelatase family protein